MDAISLACDDGLLCDPFLKIVRVESEGRMNSDIQAVLEVVVLVVVAGVLQVAAALVSSL